MKYSVLVSLLLVNISLATPAMAEEKPIEVKEIPTVEREFVNAINGFDKAQIIAQFGEPAKADDVKVKGTSKVVASIWQYHFINTSSADGKYYETTELDFIDDKVVTVVFLNNDGSEGSDNGQKYEMPGAKPDL